jgi:cytochrome c biogenesis protein CcmG/thiol:disulfide interchange protein DsbE
VRFVHRVIALILLYSSLVSNASAQLPEGLAADGAQLIWVDFWASWCAPCRRSFPWMNEMQAKYQGDGFAIIAVNVDKDRDLAAEFLAQYPAQFQIHYDPAGQLAEQFDVQAMPSSFLLDARGNVIAKHYGFRLADTDEYEAKIRAALAQLDAN